MQDTENAVPTPSKRLPWNKGKLTGAKPPLRPKHVWSIRTKLQVEGRTRDLAMFNLAIDSKLRGCDVVALKVEDVAPNGYSVDRATVRQKKTGQPVRFELTEQTRQAVDDYIKVAGKKSGESLFVGRRGQGRCMSTRQYARLVSAWIASIGLDPNLFGTHSLRRTKATLIYRRTGNLMDRKDLKTKILQSFLRFRALRGPTLPSLAALLDHGKLHWRNRATRSKTSLFLPPNRPALRAAALERKSYPEALGVAAASRSERADGVLYPSF